VIFAFSASCWNSVKTGVVELLVVFQHAMDTLFEGKHFFCDFCIFSFMLE